MRVIFVFLTISLSLATAFFPASNVDCTNPGQIQSPLCGFIPAGCLQPVCGINTAGNTQWFSSGCQLMNFNLRCIPSRFRRTIEAACPAETKPAPSMQACPWPRPR